MTVELVEDAVGPVESVGSVYLLWPWPCGLGVQARADLLKFLI